MTTLQLIADDAEPWHAATHHPFLDGVRDGTLDRIARYERDFWQMAYAGAGDG